MGKELTAAGGQELTAELAEGIVPAGQIEVLKRILAATRQDGTLPSDAELQIFLATAKHLGLDPFAGQIQMLKFDERSPYAPYTTWEGTVALAERTGLLEGIRGPWWSEDGITWLEAWIDPAKPPAAAKVGVLRKGFREPVYAVCTYKSYVRTRYDRQSSKRVPMANWATMPDRMLAKCALKLALKTAFPKQLEGISEEEPEEGSVRIDGRPGEPQSNDQRKLIFSLARDLGLSDAERHAYSEGKSWADLSAAEASNVAAALLDRLAVERPDPDPFAGLVADDAATEPPAATSEPEAAEEAKCGAWSPDGEICDLEAAHEGRHSWEKAPRSGLDQLPEDLRSAMLKYFEGDETVAGKVLDKFAARHGVLPPNFTDEQYEALRKSLGGRI